MPAYYSVVQYVPDPILDERLNIGVIVYGEGQIRCQFVSKWQRAQSFGGENISFLRAFAAEVREALNPDLTFEDMPGIWRLNEDAIRRMSGNWMNSIQLTPPRGSLLSVSELITDVSRRFLRERLVAPAHYRNRLSAAKIATDQIADVINVRYGANEVSHYLKKRNTVPGRNEGHIMDASIGNGTLVAVVQALSFEGEDTPERYDSITKAIYAISDIRSYDSDIKASIVALPPLNRRYSEQYQRAMDVFPKVGATVVTERELPSWAEDVVGLLPPPNANLENSPSG